MKIFAATIALGACLISSHAHAEESYNTTWAFVSQIGEVTTTYATMQDSEVVMPFNSQWHCHKTQVSVNDNGLFVGGFTCLEKGNKVATLFIAFCKRAAANEDFAGGTLLGSTQKTLAGSPILFRVHCMTTKVQSEIAGKSEFRL